MEDIEEYLQGMEQLIKQGYSERKFKDFSKLESQFTKRKRSMPSIHPSPPSSEQMERYIQLAVTLLDQGYSNLRDRYSTLYYMAEGLQFCGFILPRNSAASTLLSTGNDHQKIGMHIVLKFIGPRLKCDEDLRFAEYGAVGLGDGNRQRSDFILLIDQRLISVGYEFVVSSQYMNRQYINYPDLEAHAYYGSVDYLDWENYASGEVKWGFRTKQIELKFSDIEYIEAKPRHFYGPLWVRIQRSDKIQKKRGNLKCAIKVAQFEGEGDKDYKSRHEKLLARMERLAGIAQN